MKIKLDENMPAQLAGILERLGNDVETVIQEGLAGHPDSDIFFLDKQTCVCTLFVQNRQGRIP